MLAPLHTYTDNISDAVSYPYIISKDVEISYELRLTASQTPVPTYLHSLLSRIMKSYLAIPLFYFVVCYVLAQAGYFTYQRIVTHITRRRIIKENGCEPPRSFDDPSWLPFSLKFLRLIRTAAKERRFLKAAQERYQEHGNTHRLKV